MINLSLRARFLFSQLFLFLGLLLVAGQFMLGLQFFGSSTVLISTLIVGVLLLGSLWFSAAIFRTFSSFGKSVEQLKLDSKEAYSIGRNLNEAAKKLSEETQKTAAEGKNNMDLLVGSMGEISKSSKKIEEIMQIIDDIAFQINLLALNASVEAARAGEQGKGFAVVADAVRSLAHRSATAAKEINVLIQESLEKIRQGQAVAEKSAASVALITESVVKVAHHNSEIAVASQEQADGISQINLAISDLERTTIDNSSVAENASRYAKQSLSQAEGLMRLLEVLESELKGISGSIANTAEATDLDFDGAVEAHLKWKARLANYISGVSKEALKSEVVCQDNQCALGKWIHGPGTKFKSYRSFSNLREHHASFHQAAGQVVKAAQSGNKQEALRLISENSEFQKCTDQTVQSIFNLKDELKGA